jgi:hypothetical protein
LLVVLAFPAAARAATIVVDTSGPGTPTTCTLASAILAANTNGVVNGCGAGAGPTDTIEFALPSPATIVLSSELPQITANLEIAGPGAGALTVSGNHAVRVFHVGGASLSSISDLTIAAGKATFGAGILNEATLLQLEGVVVRGNEAVQEGGASIFPAGGGIYNQGGLSLVESTIAENVVKAAGGTAQNSPAGGGIYTGNAQLIVDRSTVRDNQLIASAPGAASTTNAIGGGIANNGELTLLASTVSGNTVSATGSTVSNGAAGGGITNANSGSVKVKIERSTIAANAVTAGPATFSQATGGGLAAYGASFVIYSSTLAANSGSSAANIQVATTVSVRNTIVARPLGGAPSCAGTLTSLGFNLEEANSCGFNESSDQRNLNPLLASGLAANGGPTETIALLHGSPAIDHGLSTGGETADQRGLKRPLDIPSVPNAPGSDGTDVGAFEVQVPRATIVRGPGEGESIGEAEPSFEFVADEAGATFLCTVDGSLAAPCVSPYELPKLANGQHTFTVAALGTAGYPEEPPKSRTFTVDVREPKPETPPPPAQIVKPVPRPPLTTISGLPSKTTKAWLKIRFSSNQAGSTFACKLDNRKWRSCRSPYKTPKLQLGKHIFRVRATGPTGVADPTPTAKTFRVVAPPR